MNWIEDKTTTSIGNLEKVEWIELTLVWNNFILIKMSVKDGKIYMFTESPKKYNDREFSFLRKFLGRQDVEQVKQEIIDLFNNN